MHEQVAEQDMQQVDLSDHLPQPERPRNAYASNDSGTNDCTVQCGARIDTHHEHTFTDSPVLYNVPETWLLQP